ncbi:hypothetical protein PSTG_01734 [Puccinia striiformis f. sp. tritici PST-78]|uniref:GAR domain-containing protein n=2 Tax=Puccinia striiformis f. sp. tritici TaxID=168172 RepID=A0A0L0W0P9_9BASI|nr:hypothetical protein PSTG_01734 [Puccinia striiformis f. sp. tritici PST-78]
MSSYNPPASGSQYEAHSICSFTSSSSPRDLQGLKLSKVKAAAALFESRSNMANQINKSPVDSSSTSISYSRPTSIDQPRSLFLNNQLTPPTTSQSYPSLKLSAGHVNQIKNQFLSNHSLVDLHRRHSSDRPTNKVLQNYNPEHLNRLSQSFVPNHRSNSSTSSPSTSNLSPPATTPRTATQPSHTINHNPSPSASSPSSLHRDLYKLSLQSILQAGRPRRPSTDNNQCSDSNSTSTSQHEPSSTRALSIDEPIPNTATTTTFENPTRTSDNLFSEQEPVSQHQSRPSQDDNSTLALSARINEVAMSIQEVALALFQVQELRHSSASHQSESSRHPLSSSQTSPSILAADRPSGSALTHVDKALMRLEKKVETTSIQIIELETLIRPYRGTNGTSSAQSRLVNDKFDNITEEWARIQHDTEVLKDELKEDKWLVVFRAVSGQAEEMMESLEKVLAVSQEFVRETHRRTRSNTRKTRDSHASSTSSGDPQECEELMKSYHVLIKNFHAKNKHYVPSCERVLGILSKGIKSRSTKNGEVLRRYADMNLRFSSIQERINRVGLDLLGVEKILQQACVAASDTTPAEGSVQASEQSFLQLPTDSHIPTTPTSAGSPSKTRKALTSMSNYLISTSPQFLTKHSSNGNSISPFRKLASKFTSATPSLPSQPSSVCSGQTPSFSIAGATPNRTEPSQQRSLRPMRSTLNLGPSSSSSSVSRMMSKQPAKMTPIHSGLDDRSTAPSTAPEQHRPYRPYSRQTHQHTPSYEKPRWNISLKRIEDSPAAIAGTSGSNLTKSSSSRRATPNPTASRSQSRGGIRSQSQYGFAGYDRPCSVAGRSEASCGTTLSMSAYRSRPPSRHSRIPAPLWDPSMDVQRVQSKGSTEPGDLIRPYSRAATGPPPLPGGRARPATALSILSTGLLSPTESDLAKMPGRAPTTLGLSSSSSLSHSMMRPDNKRLSHGSITSTNLPKKKRLSDINLLESCPSTMMMIADQQANPADPLDLLIHEKCGTQLTKIYIRRLDSPLSRNPEKAKLAGAGIGDQARYSFWFCGAGKPNEEKSVMCKLVEVKRGVLPTTNTNNRSNISSTGGNGSNEPSVKVLVRTKSGWIDLDSYLLDCQSNASF